MISQHFSFLICKMKLNLMKMCLHAQSLSHVQLFVTPWTTACPASLSMGFPRQEYWSGCHFLLPGISPIQGSNQSLLSLLNWQADFLLVHHLGSLQCIYNTVQSYEELWVVYCLFLPWEVYDRHLNFDLLIDKSYKMSFFAYIFKLSNFSFSSKIEI